jgi:hypothetical protein
MRYDGDTQTTGAGRRDLRRGDPVATRLRVRASIAGRMDLGAPGKG